MQNSFPPYPHESLQVIKIPQVPHEVAKPKSYTSWHAEESQLEVCVPVSLDPHSMITFNYTFGC